MHFNAHLQCKWVLDNTCLSAEQNPKVSTTKSFSSLSIWSPALPASASADELVPELRGRDGWDTVLKHATLWWGKNSWMGVSSLKLNSLPVCNFQVKWILQLTFKKGIKWTASPTTTEASIVFTVLNCKPVDTLAEQEWRTSAHIGPCGSTPLLHSLVQAASSQVLPTVLQLVSSGIFYFMMGEEKKIMPCNFTECFVHAPICNRWKHGWIQYSLVTHEKLSSLIIEVPSFTRPHAHPSSFPVCLQTVPYSMSS